MPPVSQYPKSAAVKDAVGGPELIPAAFVISMLPPPIPPSRRASSSVPLGVQPSSTGLANSQRRPTPPPLPGSVPPVAEPLSSSPTDMDIPGKRNDPPSELELLPEFRPRLRLPRWAGGLALESRALFARLMAFARRRELRRPVTIACIAALLGWTVGAKPWASRHGLQSSSVRTQPKPNRAAARQSAPSAPHHEIAAMRARASVEPGAVKAHGSTSNGQPKATPGRGQQGAKVHAPRKPSSSHSKAALVPRPPRQAALAKSKNPHPSTH